MRQNQQKQKKIKTKMWFWGVLNWGHSFESFLCVNETQRTPVRGHRTTGREAKTNIDIYRQVQID